MKKIFIIFSLIMIISAGLFGGQIINFDSEMMSHHELGMECESGACDAPVASSCAEHCYAAAVQNHILPIILSPLFIFGLILSAVIALVLAELKQSFYFIIFTLPLNRRLALNAVRRE